MFGVPMNKNKIIIAVVILVAVIAGAGIYAANKSDKAATNNSTQETAETSLLDKNSAEYKQFNELKGEDYDRMFLANMIAHHQGAVDMANLALTNAKHQELKDMANAIISAQNKEITDMQSWQSQWGYPASSGDMMMDHSAMGMMDEMAGMEDELKGKTGDEFDKAFIEQMIMHHQGALDMAAPGEKNAEHQEVKDLTKAIVTAQTKEIKQMKQWQKDWGYES
jgi:uncharacterized protein (DUF305 family)